MLMGDPRVESDILWEGKEEKIKYLPRDKLRMLVVLLFSSFLFLFLLGKLLLDILGNSLKDQEEKKRKEKRKKKKRNKNPFLPPNGSIIEVLCVP